MSYLTLEATARTPFVRLDETTASLVMRGESYPEDVPLFFAQIHEALERYFADHNAPFTLEIKLTYFNSSSARALMELLDMLDNKASDNQPISVAWHCDPDDDITREFATDISSDVQHISVEILDMAPDDQS